MNFKISEWNDDDEENEAKENNQLPTKETKSKMLILIGTVICEFDGNDWTFFPLIDQDKIGDLVISLKCPSLLEIPPKTEQAVKTFLLTGGFDTNKKATSKLCLTLNVNQSDNKDELFYSLNFGYNDMITPRFLHKTVNIDDKYFLSIGGKSNSGWLDDCELFLYESRKWIPFDKMNTKRSNFDALFLNKRVYVFGGFENVNKFSNNLIEVCDFSNTNNLSTIKWKVISVNFPSLACCRVLNSNQQNNILLIGGCDEHQIKKELYSFDTHKNELKQLGSLNTPRANFHTLHDKNELFIIGGTYKNTNDVNNISTNYIEKINLTSFKSALIPFDQNIFLNNISLCVDNNDLSIISSEFGLPYSTSIQINP
jgi:hypothetical protein